MLVSRDELRFSFQGAKFDLQADSDRKLLAWILNQFLYGEVTGIQCGYWLYRAPTLKAASFLAKQAGEELAHVRKVLRIFTLLKEKPGKANWVIRTLATGMMGSSWGEHVALEMALGEGLVLGVFYALAATIPDPAIQKILESAALEEEKHVEFGEKETEQWLRLHPDSRSLLLGLALVQLWFLQRLKSFILKKLAREVSLSHPVMGQFEAFYEHSLKCFGKRIELLKLSDVSLEKMSWGRKLLILSALPWRLFLGKFRFKNRALTAAYLEDPVLVAELKRAPLSLGELE